MNRRKHNIFQLIGRSLSLIEQKLFETTYKEQCEIQNIQLDKQKLHITVLRKQKKQLLQEIKQLQERIDQYEKMSKRKKEN